MYKKVDWDEEDDIIVGTDHVILGGMKNILIAAKYHGGAYKMIYAPWDMDISWGMTLREVKCSRMQFLLHIIVLWK